MFYQFSVPSRPINEAIRETVFNVGSPSGGCGAAGCSECVERCCDTEEILEFDEFGEQECEVCGDDMCSCESWAALHH